MNVQRAKSKKIKETGGCNGQSKNNNFKRAIEKDIIKFSHYFCFFVFGLDLFFLALMTIFFDFLQTNLQTYKLLNNFSRVQLGKPNRIIVFIQGGSHSNEVKPFGRPRPEFYVFLKTA
jgi:hypothetical protein